jgi:hypothetical protein
VCLSLSSIFTRLGFIVASCIYRGKNLTVEASSTLLKDVEAGAKLYLTVKYNSVTILKEEVDPCNQLPNVDLSRPLKKGSFGVAKEA